MKSNFRSQCQWHSAANQVILATLAGSAASCSPSAGRFRGPYSLKTRLLCEEDVDSTGGCEDIDSFAFRINGILYVERVLLSGGFHAIKWRIGNLELNHEIWSLPPKLGG